MRPKRPTWRVRFGSALTARELEVLRLLCQGMSNKRIAAGMGIAIRTIDTHRQHIMDRTGCKNPARLGAWAQRSGLLDKAPTASTRQSPEALYSRADAVALEATKAGL